MWARTQSISAQRSSSDKISAKPGIAIPPSGASIPWEIHQNNSPSLCIQRCAAVRFAGGTGKVFAAGPSPRASVPWQTAQCSGNSVAPCTMDPLAKPVGECQ